MRRSPFYAYPNFPHSFYAPPAEEAAYSYHRPSPAPTPQSIINIPVFDSSSPPQPHPITPPASPSAVPIIDPSSAATTIQSHFRGFWVRRHRPLHHLRSIAKARKQLEGLQSDVESPGFHLKVRASEKERLRFSESVMSIILRLDAIEGSIAEVRSQRKGATKMAIKIQDAVDAIMMQRDRIGDLQLTNGPFSDGGMAPEEDSVPCEKSKEMLLPDVNMVQGGAGTVSEVGIMDVNTMQEESTFPEDDVRDKCMSRVDLEDNVDEIVAPLLPLKAEDVGQQVEAGEHFMSELGCLESVHLVKPGEVMNDVEQEMTHATGENAGGDSTHGAEEEVNSGIDASHFVAHMQNNALVAMVDQETFVENIKVAKHGCAQEASSDRSLACMDIFQEVERGLSQDVELCPRTPTSEEKFNYPTPAHQNQLPGPSTDLRKLTEGNCSVDDKGSSTLHGHEYENCTDEAHENPNDVANPCNEPKAQFSTLSMMGTPLPPDSALLLQLSKDCRQLRSLVGKLLVQNKAQSKVLCALGERLELLEHQQQLNCQRNQQQMREKRKSRKGPKRSAKCCNFE